jgi:putative FmdB family regulatory protein
MPLYEYECDACGKRFEVIQKFSDPPVDTCKVCGKGPVQRLLSSPAIQFKGTGWYITDYAQKGKSDGSKGSKETSGGEKKTDTAAKTETKSESSTTPPTSSTSSSSGNKD